MNAAATIVDRTAAERGPPRLAIGAIFKNEGPYILEWIAHHRAVGIDAMVIVDNDSDDGSGALLAELDRRGIVRSFTYRTEPGVAPQLPAYARILARHASEANWFAFIDADEFIVPAPGAHAIGSAFAALAADPAVGAIAVNWAVYGSSFQADREPGLVCERFSRRAVHQASVNHHYKSIVRASALVEGHPVNPHHFQLGPGYRYVHADGSELVEHPRRGPGLSAKTVWTPLRINHYVVKSREEFFRRKQPRGRAAQFGGRRPDAFFEQHDRNDQYDPLPESLVRRVEEELEILSRELGDCAAAWLPAKPAHAAASSRGTSRCHGVLEAIGVDGARMTLSGWATGRDGRRAEVVAVRMGEREVRDFRTRIRPRHDVVRRFSHASLDCGFELTFDGGASCEATVPVAVFVAQEPDAPRHLLRVAPDARLRRRT